MQEVRSSNPPMVTEICDPNKYRARHHGNDKGFFSFLKYFTTFFPNQPLSFRGEASCHSSHKTFTSMFKSKTIRENIEITATFFTV